MNSLSGKLVFGIVTVILAMWISPKGFNEPTQAYHLAHCYNDEPVSMLAQMLILMLGFVLFSAFA